MRKPWHSLGLLLLMFFFFRQAQGDISGADIFAGRAAEARGVVDAASRESKTTSIEEEKEKTKVTLLDQNRQGEKTETLSKTFHAFQGQAEPQNGTVLADRHR